MNFLTPVPTRSKGKNVSLSIPVGKLVAWGAAAKAAGETDISSEALAHPVVAVLDKDDDGNTIGLKRNKKGDIREVVHKDIRMLGKTIEYNVIEYMDTQSAEKRETFAEEYEHVAKEVDAIRPGLLKTEAELRIKTLNAALQTA